MVRRARTLLAASALAIALGAVYACGAFSGSGGGAGAGADGSAGGDARGSADDSAVGVDDSAIGVNAPLGALSDAGIPDAASFAACTNGTHYSEKFDTPAFPPSPWSNGSFGPGSVVSLEKTNVLSGTGSLKATVVNTDVSGVGALLSLQLSDLAAPRAIHVAFAYSVPSQDNFTGDFYAELGCQIDYGLAQADNATFAYDSMSWTLSLDTQVAPIQFGLASPGWYQFDTFAALSGASATAAATIGTPDGGQAALGPTQPVAVDGGLIPIYVYCGIPYAKPGAAKPTLDVYIDDITVDVCP